VDVRDLRGMAAPSRGWLHRATRPRPQSVCLPRSGRPARRLPAGPRQRRQPITPPGASRVGLMRSGARRRPTYPRTHRRERGARRASARCATVRPMRAGVGRPSSIQSVPPLAGRTSSTSSPLPQLERVADGCTGPRPHRPCVVLQSDGPDRSSCPDCFATELDAALKPYAAVRSGGAASRQSESSVSASELPAWGWRRR
jgi:hypothetical protein